MVWCGAVYRVITAPLQHLGLVHFAVNMVSFVPLGTVLEKKIGTFQFCYAMSLFTVLGAIAFILFAFMVRSNSCVFVHNRCLPSSSLFSSLWC